LLETIKLVLTHFNNEVLLILTSIFAFNLGLFFIVWFANKKKFHQYGHQIPSSVVNNYLETLIQNSAALRSSLLRGAENLKPFVVSPGGEGRSGSDGGASLEELEAKIAEISQLKGKVTEKDKMLRELENKMGELENQLREASLTGGSGGGPDAEKIKKEITDIQNILAQKEEEMGGLVRDNEDLKGRLQEYEIIEDDLANLKKFQSENTNLKNKVKELEDKLKSGGGSDSSNSTSGPSSANGGSVASQSSATESIGASAKVENNPVDSDDLLGSINELNSLDSGTEASSKNPLPSNNESEATEISPQSLIDNLDAGPPKEKKKESEKSESAKSKKSEKSEKSDSNIPPDSDEGNEKSAEDLLSEFEKMLE
jgi:hypothetical protein